MRVGVLTLDRPLVLAPMEDVTGLPFRRVCRRLGADMVYSEFTSADGLVRGAAACLAKIRVADDERPVGIQLFGSDPEAMAGGARVAEAARPDLIDINFGCPVCAVTDRGAGASLLRDPERMERIAAAVVRATTLPVTAKTRLGWDAKSIRIVEVARRLEGAGIRALALHARTRAQGRTGRADWVWIGEVKRAVGIPVIGNGDVLTPEDVRCMFDETGCDAVMIGRGALANPWLFREAKQFLALGALPPPPSLEERLATCLEHLRATVAEKGERHGLISFRKYYPGYLPRIPFIARFRQELMEARSIAEVEGKLAALRERGAVPAQAAEADLAPAIAEA
jgi:tRNA-dihydrouridine synthase B